MKTLKPPLLMSHYPSGRWVATGQTGAVLTSECDCEKLLEFARKNDVSPSALPLLQVRELAWPKAMFEIPTEHKTDTGGLLFTDRGNRITFDRVRVSDDEIKSALVHAQQKFGTPLTLTGDNSIFTARMARLAGEMGIEILK